MSTPPPLCKLLPTHIAERLREAARVSEPFERLRAIAHATAEAQRACPQAFWDTELPPAAVERLHYHARTVLRQAHPQRSILQLEAEIARVKEHHPAAFAVYL
ncbi:MAG TPA: hypothetical protein VGC24_09555 [Burkholderiaceae bacterium]